MAKKSPTAEATPATMLRRDIEGLRKDFRVAVKAYSAQVEEACNRLLAKVRAIELTGAAAAGKSCHFEMRDASAAIRSLQLRPAKGRRKDLKKIDQLVADLEQALADW